MEQGWCTEVKSIFVFGFKHDLQIGCVSNGERRSRKNGVETNALNGGPNTVNCKANTGLNGRFIKGKARQVIHTQSEVKMTWANRWNQQIKTEFSVTTSGSAPVVVEIPKDHVKGSSRRRSLVFREQYTTVYSKGLAGSDNGLNVLRIVVIFAVAKFYRTNVACFGIKSEVIVQTPPIITHAETCFKARFSFAFVARQVSDQDLRHEMTHTIRIERLGELPCQLEACLDDNNTLVVSIKVHRWVKVWYSDEIRASLHYSDGVPISIRCKTDEQWCLIIIQISTKCYLNELNVIPTVLVTDENSCSVRNTRMKWLVVIMAKNGRIAQVDRGFKLLPDGVCG